MGLIHSNTFGLYNNKKKKKSRNIHYQKTLTLNPNPNPKFYKVKLENYGINVTPDKNGIR